MADHDDDTTTYGSLLEHEFLPLGDTPNPISDLTATAVDNYIYLIGGCADDAQDSSCVNVVDTILKYSPTADDYLTITNTPTLLNKRHRHSAASLGVNIYVFGGRDESDQVVTAVEVFNTETGIVSEVQGVTVSTSDGAAFTFDDKVYYCGGWVQDYTPSSDCIILSADESTEVGPSLNTARGDFQVATNDGQAYAFGGFDASFGVLGALEVLDSSGAWVDHASDSLGLARGDKALAFLHDKMYVFGGEISKDNVNYPMPDVYEFSPLAEDVNGNEGVWTDVGELPAPMFRFAAVAFDDYIYLFGGQGRQNDDGYPILSTVYRFVEAENLFDHPTIALHGSGTTNPSRFFWKWMNILTSRSKVPIRMTYRAVGSGTGQADFAIRPSVVDFACGDIPLSKDKYDEITGQGHEILHIPFALGTISVFANIPGLTQPLQLKSCTLAKIYLGEITTWNNEEIVKLNPGLDDIVNSDDSIVVGIRKKGSSSTFGVSQYMYDKCRDLWTETPDSLMPGTIRNSAESESNTVYQIVEGSSQMTGLIEGTPYSIGYLDSGHGIDSGLQEVALYQDTIEEFVTSTSDKVVVDQGALTADWPNATDDWSSFSLNNVDSESGGNEEVGGWPITVVSYFYVNRDMRGTGMKASLLKAWLKFVFLEETDTAVQSDLASFSFYLLPESVIQDAINSIDMIYSPLNAPEFSFEWSTIENGNDDYVISSKRNPKPVYLEDVAASTETLSVQSVAMESRIDELEDLIESYQSTQDIAIASIVLSCLTLVGTMLAIALGAFSSRAVPCAKETEMRDQTNGAYPKELPGGAVERT